MIKYLTIPLIAITFSLNAQDLKISKKKDENITHLLNNIKLFESINTDEYLIKIYSIDNGAGSAGFPNSEVSHNLLIAISEYDSAPDQNLFEIGEMYNPKFVKWIKNPNNKSVNFVIEYGPINKTKTKELSVDITNLMIVKK